MIDTPTILEVAPQRLAAIHVVVPRAEIQQVMGPGIGELMSTLAAQGIAPAGPWRTMHLRFDDQVFDFEIAVPVDRPVVPAGRVKQSSQPGGTIARTVHHGAYEGLAQAWPELSRWIEAQGRKPGMPIWEVYLTDPGANPDPATWQTELNRLLVEEAR
jgi:effector-binding domain-containing protein